MPYSGLSYKWLLLLPATIIQVLSKNQKAEITHSLDIFYAMLCVSHSLQPLSVILSKNQSADTTQILWIHFMLGYTVTSTASTFSTNLFL